MLQAQTSAKSEDGVYGAIGDQVANMELGYALADDEIDDDEADQAD